MVTVTNVGPNELDVSAPRGRVRTLDELIAAAQIDLDVWECVEVSPNSYESFMKNDDGEAVVVPLWQVKARFRRRDMEALMPVLRPIEVAAGAQIRMGNRRPSPGVRRVLVLPDPQFGFVRAARSGALEPLHDRRALDVALQIAYEVRPHDIVWLGDMLDAADWSDKFVSSPEFSQQTQPAVIEAHWWLRRFAEARPSARRHVLEGNHDKRLPNALLVHLRAAYGLRAADELARPAQLTLARLLALDSLGYTWSDDYPNGVYELHPQFWLIHGDLARNRSGATVASLLDQYDVSVIQGHIHRIEMAARTTKSGRQQWAASPGCLCRVDGIVPGRSARQNWQQGVAVIYMDGDAHHLQLVGIREGRALFGERLVVGGERVTELAADTGWSF